MPQPTDDAEREFLSIIERYRWHVMMVGADVDSPGFAYSTGIFRLTGMPELIVFSLALDVAHFVINEYGNRAMPVRVCLRARFTTDLWKAIP